MKIHYPKLLRLLQIVALLWLVLAVAKLVHFDFNLKISILFKVFWLGSGVTTVLEFFKNWGFIRPKLKAFFQKIRNQYLVADQIVKQKLSHFPGLLRSVVSFFRLPLVLIVILTPVFAGQSQRSDYFKYGILLLGGLLIMKDIFTGQWGVEWQILVISALMVLIFKIQKTRGEVSFLAGIFFLALCPFLLIFNKVVMAERSALWAYIFLCLGSVRLALTILNWSKNK